MKNVFLRFFREHHGLNKRQVARSLGITSAKYNELETGQRAMTPDHAKALQEMYNTEAYYFMESSRQLELFHAREAIIKTLQAENKKLNQLMEDGYELLHQSKLNQS